MLGLDDSFEIVIVQGRTLAGVHDATSKAAALELAGKLRQGRLEFGRGGQGPEARAPLQTLTPNPGRGEGGKL